MSVVLISRTQAKLDEAAKEIGGRLFTKPTYNA